MVIGQSGSESNLPGNDVAVASPLLHVGHPVLSLDVGDVGIVKSRLDA